ncbi:KR domain-containing protein, partial [Streptomyces sp. 2MCAF27]
LEESGGATPLWIATRGAVAARRGHAEPRPEQAQFWGLGGALARERPDCWGGLIDLPDRLDGRTGRWLAGALAADHGEGEIAVRLDGRYVRRLVRTDPPAAAPGGWRPTGTVLLTGADTALGAEAARWLADAGAEQLLLMGGAPSDALVAELVAAGTEVIAVAADPADRDELDRA